jgi:ATP-dependent Lhr-like helicase
MRGFHVPSDRRITVEEWEDYIILHAHFGSLTNRALAQLLGHVISERTGYSVATQHDPYRIFIQATGQVRAGTLIGIIDEIRNASPEYIEDTLTRACVRTGIFKRRLIHVARRFGALKKWVDFSSVSLQSLIKSFEGTVIYQEALKEVFTKDLDLKQLVEVFQRIKEGDIEIVKVEAAGEPSPLARLGIEKVSMKTDLIPPEKMRRILLESARARLLDETRVFICTDCWDYLESIRISSLPLRPECPRCGSRRLGMLGVEENKAYVLVEKKGQKLRKSERKLRNRALQTADLISNYGKAAAVVLSGKGLRPSDAREILKKESNLSDDLFSLILEAERNALKRRFL